MKILHKFVALMIILPLILVSFSSCNNEKDGRNYSFTFNLSENPGNLDPQLAEDSASIEIIKNTFRGLIKQNSDGSLTPDAAEIYTMSEDGKTYTFELKKDIKWINKTEYEAPLMAKDYVYAFRRIFNPESSSPYREKFLCIKNAQKIIDGKMSYGMIGVTALDDYTLEISLEYAYFDILTLLAQTPAMPCNEAFFQLAKGRYGLSIDTSISNGAFYVADWNFDPYWHENYIELYRNNTAVTESVNEKGEITSAYDTIPHSVHYNIKSANNDFSDFSAGDIDGFRLADFDKKILSSNSYKAEQTKTYTLFANPNSSISDPRLMRVLGSFDFEFDEKLLDMEKLVRAKGILPEAVSIMGKSYRSIVSDNALYDNNINTSKLWNEAIGENPDGLADVRITVGESFPEPQLIYDLADDWREIYNVNFLVEVVSENEYELKLGEMNYDLILFPITANENDATLFFKVFESGNAFGIEPIQTIDENIAKLSRALSLSNAADYLRTAEKAVINNGFCIPLFYGYEYYVYNKNASDIEYLPFTKDLILQKAKMY